MQSSKVRPEPAIPDHEVLRKIGGGAYGEVWLARGVTGALRAVKTVWHNDFDDERGFEREFEGILKYEPISRDHPGLVHILHVGRSEVEAEPFYYYVMELGDDVVKRRDINPVEYEPRTLRSDMKAAEGKAIDVEECITVGRLLAEGLNHLHHHGLAHRDVKPSNVIFVDGKAKLADIGLVALRGQQTFVGTEGFVPPEGPGSTQADVYSLGKVLYEMATGKDRLDFPELPDELPEGAKLKRWRLLNSVICDVCEPKISRRKLQTAAELAAELGRLEAGRRRPVRVRPEVVAVLLATAAGVVGGAQLIKWEPKEITSLTAAQRGPVPIEMGQIRLISTPGYARVFSEGREIARTPTDPPLEYPMDSIVNFTLKLKGYRDCPIEVEVTEAINTEIVKLSIYRPPEVGTDWNDVFMTEYGPENETHVSKYFVSASEWSRYLGATDRSGGKIVTLTENGMEHDVVIATEDEARQYTAWLEEQCRDEYLEEEHWIEPRIEKSRPLPEVSPEEAQERRPFWCVVRKYNEASTYVATNPPGADIYLDGELLGTTKSQPGKEGSAPFKIVAKLGKGVDVLHPDVVIEKPGYQRKRLKELITLVPDQHDPVEMAFTHTLELENILSRKLTNSIEMEFVPVGDQQNLLASKWETRVQDYAKYVLGTNGKVSPPPAPKFAQDDSHPVVNVTREDAEEFCRWLTQKEHESGHLEKEYEYRLPTDAEWSMLIELKEDPDKSPAELHGKLSGYYWGSSKEPPSDGGNFADEATGHPEDKIIEYYDGHPFTAPVGSYTGIRMKSGGEEEDQHVLFDLEGNVLEWVSDDYDDEEPGSEANVARGASFRTFVPAHLQKSARFPVAKGAPASDDQGFRVVLAKVPAKAEKEPGEAAEPTVPSPERSPGPKK